MRFRLSKILCLGCGLLLLAACTPALLPTATPNSLLLTAPPTAPASEAPNPTLAATATANATPTPVVATPVVDELGVMGTALAVNHTVTFMDWFVFNPGQVEAASDNGDLVLTLKSRALWFMDQRGVLLYELINGNFTATATVQARKYSDLTQPPEGPVVQLGGLMARSTKPGPENYVFIVVGQDVDDLSVETKNTVDSLSKFQGPTWGSGDAELRICRVDATFNLYKRHLGDKDWSLALSVERPDLPKILEVGPNIYSDGKPDLQVRYDDVRIQPVSDMAGCTKD